MSALLLDPPLSPARLAPVIQLRPDDTLIARAEAQIERHQYAEAVETLAGAEVTLRSLLAESWARMYLGELAAALTIAERARALAERPEFSDTDRAEALYRIGCCRFKLSQTTNAVALLTLSLELADRALSPSDRLRARILEWRSRCYQRQRDWDAARADVERALELAESAGDEHVVAHVTFQASLVAERTGQRLLARCYAEQAKEIYERHDDRQSVARLLNNLGGLTFLMGEPDAAIAYLKESISVGLDIGSDADAGQAISSLAQVLLRTGDHAGAEAQATVALRMLDGRDDYLDERANARLVLGRSLLAQDREDEAGAVFRAAAQEATDLGCASHRAAVWTAQGELAQRRGDLPAAATFYRSAADELQDLHF